MAMEQWLKNDIIIHKMLSNKNHMTIFLVYQGFLIISYL